APPFRQKRTGAPASSRDQAQASMPWAGAPTSSADRLDAWQPWPTPPCALRSYSRPRLGRFDPLPQLSQCLFTLRGQQSARRAASGQQRSSENDQQQGTAARINPDGYRDGDMHRSSPRIASMTIVSYRIQRILRRRRDGDRLHRLGQGNGGDVDLVST